MGVAWWEGGDTSSTGLGTERSGVEEALLRDLKRGKRNYYNVINLLVY